LRADDGDLSRDGGGAFGPAAGADHDSPGSYCSNGIRRSERIDCRIQ
jgi:hypothetical protein